MVELAKMERREKRSRLLGAALTLAIAVLASASARAESTVRVAIHDTPFSTIDETGQPEGFYVDIIEHIAAAEGWEITYAIGTWTEIVEKFERGQVDLLFPIVPSEQNALRYDLTDEPLLSTWGEVFAKPAAGIESLLDLAGRRVAVVEGDLFGRELVTLLAEFELSAEIERVASTDAVFKAIAAGRVEAGAVERMDGYLHTRETAIEQTPIVFTPVSAHIATAKGRRPDVLAAIDRHLTELKGDPESLYHRSYASWFERGGDPGFPTWAKWTLAIGGGLLVILFAFAVALRVQVARRTRELSEQNAKLAEEIAHRERTEQEKAKLEAQLLQSQKLEAIGQLAGGVAHDFNNMLGAIVGCGELALHKLPRHEPSRKEVRQVVYVAEKAASLTQQLLAFSRKQNLRPQVIGLNELVDDTRKMLGRLLGEQVRLETELAADLWLVEVDPAQLQQVIINLAVNARDAMPEGGRLLIESRNLVVEPGAGEGGAGLEPGEYVTLRVSDTGSGMEPELIEQIFEPFFTTKKPGRGTGLGLSTSYGIVKQSGGEIDVTSIPGQGTSFTIHLPRATDDAEPVSAVGSMVEGARRDEAILLVEDEEMLREATERILAMAGFVVHAAASGHEALEIADGGDVAIDLVVTDVVMPQMRGPELVQRLRERRPELRVLYITGYADEEALGGDALGPGVRLLRKPFRAQEIVDTALSLVARRTD